MPRSKTPKEIARVKEHCLEICYLDQLGKRYAPSGGGREGDLELIKRRGKARYGNECGRSGRRISSRREMRRSEANAQGAQTTVDQNDLRVRGGNEKKERGSIGRKTECTMRTGIFSVERRRGHVQHQRQVPAESFRYTMIQKHKKKRRGKESGKMSLVKEPYGTLKEKNF